MIYEVKIIDPRKHSKKIISVKELSRRHWAEFEKKQKGFASPRKNKTKPTLQ
jgi:hypothetical protein